MQLFAAQNVESGTRYENDNMVAIRMSNASLISRRTNDPLTPVFVLSEKVFPRKLIIFSTKSKFITFLNSPFIIPEMKVTCYYKVHLVRIQFSLKM